MDIPDTRLLQVDDINLNQSRNEEEQEDLEDQKRRKEELHALLGDKLNDYDESTDDSIVSGMSCNDAESNKYLQANNQHEQLQNLYEVRLRELQALREEHKGKTEGFTKEIKTYKRQLLLTKAELEQIKVSYKNSEDLLVEKTSNLKDLEAMLESKEQQIQNYEKNIQNMQLEIATYKTTINDLYLQMQDERNPFNKYNKQFISEEYKNATKEQINRLEELLEEKNKSVKTLEKANLIIEEELNKLRIRDIDSRNTIEVLQRNFDSAQTQCVQLIAELEALTNEMRHLEGRVQNMYESSPRSERLSYGKNSVEQQIEKLRKMLLDKKVHIDTLNVKLRNHDKDVKELLEYRQLKADVFKKDFQQYNEDHTKSLIILQYEIQNYRTILEDKDQQIRNLHSINKDNLAKMEGKIFQNKNDINNLSNKYSIPQLDKMTEDLKTSYDQIAYLEEQLKMKTTEIEKLLNHQECNKERELKTELDQLKLLNEKERNNLENEIKKLTQEIEVSSAELQNLKTFNEKLIDENVKLKSRCKEEDNSLKDQYLESIKALHEAQSKITSLQEKIEELTNLKTIAEGESCTYQSKLKEYEQKLEDATKDIEELEMDLENTLKQLKEKEETIKHLKEVAKTFRQELKNKMDKSLERTINELRNKEDIIHNLQQTVSSLRKELDNIKTTKEIEITNAECKKCKNYQDIIDRDVSVKDKKKQFDGIQNIGEENLQKIKEANMIAIEVKLREEIQEEYFTKLKEVENKYKQVYASSKDLRKEKVDQLKVQEMKFREDLATILGECTKKIKEYEQNKQEIVKQYQDLQNQFEQYKILCVNKERNFERTIEKFQLNSKQEAEKWRKWSQRLINSCITVEKTNKKTRDHVLFKMATYDAEVAVIEKSYEKVKELLSKGKK
ncbi:putative autophagy-related protein 11 isoform X2 [Diabrotica virgifera virgifera]|uniref:Leucine-rich repeat-containing protein DDB_G0290503 n=1 Tax=Diabrotica virgifera virgifera TaxID=50390 RepID=A0ABM5KRY4_DIAVI|nr:putative autophagy-related protein 11 isoform X2 [Diabrotica virgifera virgifera]